MSQKKVVVFFKVRDDSKDIQKAFDTVHDFMSDY